MYKWAQEMPCAVTVCDMQAKIIYMNDKSKKTFEKYGDNLIGRSLKEFHNKNSWIMIQDMLKNEKENHYTIEKNGIKKIIHQTLWYDNGNLGGLVEFSFEIPFEMSHFVRK